MIISVHAALAYLAVVVAVVRPMRVALRAEAVRRLQLCERLVVIQLTVLLHAANVLSKDKHRACLVVEEHRRRSPRLDPRMCEICERVQ